VSHQASEGEGSSGHQECISGIPGMRSKHTNLMCSDFISLKPADPRTPLSTRSSVVQCFSYSTSSTPLLYITACSSSNRAASRHHDWCCSVT
jgi:hypothetical protein